MKEKVISLNKLLTMFLFAVFFMLITPNINVFAAEAEIATIPDANLKSELNKALGVSTTSADITKEQLNSLTYLNLSNKDIKSFKGLEMCTSLERLNIRDNPNIVNTEELRNINSLKRILFFNCENLTDISGVTSNTTLVDISLTDCDKLVDISSVSNLSDLSSFSIINCDMVTDISVISNLINLQYVNLEGCDNIDDFSALSNLTKIIALSLNNSTNITTLPDLSKLTKLFRVEFKGCTNLTDITGISQSTSIAELFLNDCTNLSDISGISKLTGMLKLSLDNCDNITDLSAISNFNNMTSLSLNGCDMISDLSPLKFLLELYSLDLSNTKITDISPLVYIYTLEYLYLENCTELFDITPLKKFRYLGTLNLSNVKINNINEQEYIETLASFEGLTELNISNINLKDEHLSKLSNFSTFGKLIINDNNITDFTFAEKFTAFKNTSFTSKSITFFDIARADGDNIVIKNDVIDRNGKPVAPDKSDLYEYDSASNTIKLYPNKFDVTQNVITYNFTIKGNKDDFCNITHIKKITYEPMKFFSQPKDLVVKTGYSLDLYIEVIGDGDIQYQWYKDGKIIEGKRSNNFYISHTDKSSAGKYRVKVTNEYETLFSREVTVEIKDYLDLKGYLTLGFNVPDEYGVGSTIDLHASASGGDGGYNSYKYEYMTLNPNTNKWVVIKDYSKEKTCEYQLNYPGTKYFLVNVKDSLNNICKSNIITVNVTKDIKPLSVDFRFSKYTDSDDNEYMFYKEIYPNAINIEAVELGKEFFLDVECDGGVRKYEYKFAQLNEKTGKWTILHEYSSTSHIDITLNEAGSYQFAVSVKDAKGTIVSGKRIKLKCYEPMTANIYIDNKTDIVYKKSGDIINANVSVKGGSGQYAYYYYMAAPDDLENGIMFLNYMSSELSHHFNSTLMNYLGVEVYDLKTFQKTYDVIEIREQLTGELLMNHTTTSRNLKKGTKINIEAVANGGSGEYTYKFAVLNADTGKWSVLRDFSEDSSLDYSLNYLGKKQFAVTIKDSYGNLVATNRLSINVISSETELYGVLSINNSTKDIAVSNKENIEIKASGYGGTGNYTYKFAYLNIKTGIWTVLQDFSKNNTVLFDLSSISYGDYQFAVSVKDSSKKTVAANRVKISYNNFENHKLLISGTSDTVYKECAKFECNDDIVLYPEITTDCNDNVLYLHGGTDTFLEYILFGEYTDFKNITLSNLFISKYYISTAICDSYSNIYSSLNGVYLNIFLPLQGTLTVNDSTKDLTLKKGSLLELTARGMYGAEIHPYNTQYSYKFAVLNEETGKWTVLRDFNTDYALNYSLDYVGKKQFAVTIMDRYGNTVATNRISVNVIE